MTAEQVEIVNGIPCKVTKERFLGGYLYVYTFTVPGWDECTVIGRRAAKRVINGRCDPAVRNPWERGNKMSELKPCPFCGGEADYRTENFGARVWVQCLECGASTSRYDTNLLVDGKGGKEWAIEAWNRRAENGK